MRKLGRGKQSTKSSIMYLKTYREYIKNKIDKSMTLKQIQITMMDTWKTCMGIF
jgi:hypothetical protein